MPFQYFHLAMALLRQISLLLLLSLLTTDRHAQAQVDLEKINEQVAQKINKGVTVTGRVYDSVLQEPIAYGSVILSNQVSGEEFGKNTDSSGNFHFEGIAPGSYTFAAMYVGYPKLEQEITITGPVNLGTLYMRSGSARLDEVEIVSFKDLIESRPDGIVYNADKDGTNQGTMASDLLKKVPMVTVDLDGNVQLRGNGNIKVLIDGKPSTIIAASVKDALKQLPSDNIKSVEVITSPGAKYDAEGTAGVINIVTKKQVMKGFSGIVYSSLKYRFEDERLNGHAGFNLNYSNDKLHLSAYFGGGHWTNIYENELIRNDFPGTAQASVLRQSMYMDGGGSFFWGGLSGNYEFDSLNNLQLGLNISPGSWGSDIQQETRIPLQNIRYTRSIEQDMPRQGYSVNAGYTRKFKNDPKRTLDVLALYSTNRTGTDYKLVQTDHAQAEDVINYQEQNNNDATNNEFTLQTDYVHPFKKHNQKLEAGLKYIRRDVGSVYNLSNWINNGNGFTPDPNRSNALNYTQQVGAAYTQFSSNLSKSLSAIVGLRYEFTDIQGTLRDNGGDFGSTFHNVLPNAILSWKLKSFNTLKLSYNQRIERPSIDFINPYINYTDPFNISQGNPQLEPERSHNIELGYNTFLGNSSINFSSFYRLTNNAIESVTSVDENGIARTTFGNFAENKTLGFNLFGSTRLFNKWMINLTGNLYYKDLYSPGLDIRNDGWEYDVNLYTSLQIMSGLSLEGFGMYSGNKVTLQGKTSGWYYYTLGLKKSVLKGKADLALAAENIFTPYVKVTTENTFNNSVYTSEGRWYGQGIQLSFVWRFGNMKFSAPQKGVDNDDLKKAEDQQGMGGGQMGGGGGR